MATSAKKKTASPKAVGSVSAKTPKTSLKKSLLKVSARSKASLATEDMSESAGLSASETPAPQASPSATASIRKVRVREKIKKLPAAAKTAPKKIVERTLEATLKTVEKAAETEAQKAAKKALKATVKARKALKKMAEAKKAARRAGAKAAEIGIAFPQNADTAFSAPAVGSEKKSATAKTAATLKQASGIAQKAAHGIKQKLNKILHHDTEEVFYYERRQIIILTLIYAAIACLVWFLTHSMLCDELFTSWLMVILAMTVMVLSLAAFGSVVFVLIFPQKLAVVTNKGIKIDHNAFLQWKDVALAEEKYTNLLIHRPIIALHLVPGAKYRLTFMQHLCRHNVFTPFSIPLYAMVPEDAAKIRTLIKRYVDYKDSRD